MSDNVYAFLAGFGLAIFLFLTVREIKKQYEFSSCEQIKAQCREVLSNKVNQGGCE